MRKAMLSVALAVAMCVGPASASGPYLYDTPFVHDYSFESVLTIGVIPHYLDPDELETLVVFLRLAGRFREEHVELFRSVAKKPEDRGAASREFERLRREVRLLLVQESDKIPPPFDVIKDVAYDVSWRDQDGTVHTSTSHRPIRNCQVDAYQKARATFLARRSRYGRGSVELSRWADAQMNVFGQCGGNTTFDPPAEPEPDWEPLEQHDRRYQIAAAYFYNGHYLEAASRFREIAQTPESPWRDLARYLVPRSLAREALVNENDEERHLQAALDGYRELANDEDYPIDDLPVAGQIRHLEAQRDPTATRRVIEELIVNRPDQATAQDMRDYVYLRRRWNAWSYDDEASEFERWRRLLSERDSTAALEHWRDRRSLPWLFMALEKADFRLGVSALTELLDAADALPDETPGHFNILLNRIRIRGLLGESEVVSRLFEDAVEDGIEKSDMNLVRMAAAEGALNWNSYFRWVSVKPLSLPWTDDFARRLPANFNRITTDTPVFFWETAALLNRAFTPAMFLEVIDSPGLGAYQRGRMAIAGWTKAMLMDDLTNAVELSRHVARNVPFLADDFGVFEDAHDMHFEAARIILEYPAFSPWMWGDAGRVQHHLVRRDDGTYRERRPIPDHVADGLNWLNWWCASSEETIERIRIPDAVLQHPRFSHYSEAEIDASRRMVDLRRTAATTAFGPHVIRYAKNNLDDPRVPRTLHRLVFATRHACMTVPGEISRAAFALLHKHFPDSEWAEKTPYWYD